jgi:plasmid maintenance system antidote protein VapI
MENPRHPGDLIKTEIIEALGLNVTKAAEAFGQDVDRLLRMQLAYDLAQNYPVHTRNDQAPEISRATWLRQKLILSLAASSFRPSTP